jgi:hypothetical protein
MMQQLITWYIFITSIELLGFNLSGRTGFWNCWVYQYLTLPYLWSCGRSYCMGDRGDGSVLALLPQVEQPHAFSGAVHWR